eukprot:tig00021037_g17487.t1
MRAVKKLITSMKMKEGGGFIVRRPVGSGGLSSVDPLLMLDHMGPVEYGPGEAVGAPDHPHRGQETVTYILEGELQHKDSAGHTGVLQSGDVQWMTAGRGVVHSEMPSDRIIREGGRIEGFQLWVNLPRVDKMMPPRYQDIRASSIPTATSPDGKVTVRVVAGESMGHKAVIDTRTPIMYLDIALAPGAEFTQPVPPDFNAFAYVFRGAALFGPAGQEREAKESDAVELGPGDSLRMLGGDQGARLLLIGGRPINEPVVWHGPFVMNAREEIEQAMQDYRAGRLGAIEGAEERYRQTEAARARAAASDKLSTH